MPIQPSRVATVILAGGQGTRLFPLTVHHSKPAVSYGGRYRLIDIPISSAINSNFRQIFVIAQYLSGELQHHISQTYPFDPIDVLTPQEDEKGQKQFFAGTADAVRKNLPTLLKSPADFFLILSGDQLYNIDFQHMLAAVETTGADVSIASMPVLHKEAPRMGLLKIDAQGKVVDFVEKPQEADVLRQFELEPEFFQRCGVAVPQEPCYLGSMGIYIFRRDVLIALLEQDGREDFGFHLIKTAVKNWKTFAFLYRGYWEDIGTVSSYFEANLLLTHSGKGLDTYDEVHPIYTRPTYLPGPKICCTKIIHSIICEGSIIEAAEISDSVIGLRSHISEGSIIRNTVMMGNHLHEEGQVLGNFGIGKNCHIDRAIIDEHVCIGNNVRLLNEQKLQRYDGEGIFIRDGIIIVTAGTIIPDGFVI